MKRLPKQMHILQGTYRPARHDGEPEFPAASSKPPKHLTPAARAVWRKEAVPLIDAGILTEADVPMMADLCSLTASYRAVMQEIGNSYVVDSKRDDGAQVKNPAWQIARDMLQLINSMRLQFGLSPVSRAKVTAPAKQKPASEWDEFSQPVKQGKFGG